MTPVFGDVLPPHATSELAGAGFRVVYRDTIATATTSVRQNKRPDQFGERRAIRLQPTIPLRIDLRRELIIASSQTPYRLPLSL